MAQAALLAWLGGCFAVFYLTLDAAGSAFRRLEASTGVKLEAIWAEGVPPRRVLYGSAGAAAVAGILVGLAVHPVLGVLSSLSILALPPFLLKALEARRRAAFEAQLADALEGLVGSLRSGFGLEQGLRLLSEQAPSPMRQEIGLLVREAGMGTPLEEALANLSRRMPGEDLDLFVSAVALSRETGGSLAEVLGEIAATVRRRRELKGRLAALTAQGRLQGVVLGAVPVGLGIVLYFLDPVRMGAFLSSPKGWAVLALGAVLETVGLLWIRRIVRLDP